MKHLAAFMFFLAGVGFTLVAFILPGRVFAQATGFTFIGKPVEPLQLQIGQDFSCRVVALKSGRNVRASCTLSGEAPQPVPPTATRTPRPTRTPWATLMFTPNWEPWTATPVPMTTLGPAPTKPPEPTATRRPTNTPRPTATPAPPEPTEDPCSIPYPPPYCQPTPVYPTWEPYPGPVETQPPYPQP